VKVVVRQHEEKEESEGVIQRATSAKDFKGRGRRLRSLVTGMVIQGFSILSIPEPKILMRPYMDSGIPYIDHVSCNLIFRLSRNTHESISANPLRVVGKVGQAEHSRGRPRALISKDRRVASMEANSSTTSEFFGRLTYLDQVSHASIQAARDGRFVMSLIVAVSRAWGSVNPSAVVHLCGIVDVRVIVQLANLVSEVDKWNAACAHGY
jgi:hypothetical protein